MKNLKSRVESAKAEHSHLKRKLEEELELHVLVKKSVSRIEQAQEIVQFVAKAVQEQAHQKIASVVSKCLEAVFDDPYGFVIDFEEKRGKTEAVFSFEREGMKVDPMSASGGGVVDVATFALRLACLMLSAPRKRKLLVLDEPFRFVSRDLRGKVKEMLETLAEEMDVQFVIVTHDPALVAGKVVELT